MMRIVIVVITLNFVSCHDTFLDLDPESAISTHEFFLTDSQLETAVVAMYDGMQGVNIFADNDITNNHAIQIEFYVTEMRSDNAKSKNSGGEIGEFERFAIDPSNSIVLDYYRSMYNIVYRANIVLENLKIASDEKAIQFEGEARFVRAYAYYNLVRLFGPVPLVDHVIRPQDKEIQFTRIAEDIVYEFIIGDLSIAIHHLDDKYKTRASKSAAQALLAKIYLSIGRYEESRALCESVISKDFELMADYKDVFFNELNKEIIFAIGFLGDDSENSQNFSAEWLNAVGKTSGVNYPTREVVEFLQLKAGDRARMSIRQDPVQSNLYQVVKYLPNGDEMLGIEPTATNPRLAGNDWIVIRYADVLLMHVESILGMDLYTAELSAIRSFQLVRERAGFYDVVDGISKEELLDERRAEFAFENQRLFDLLRLGVAHEVLSEFAKDNEYSFEMRDLLLPIPQREINLSDGQLLQNPGY